MDNANIVSHIDSFINCLDYSKLYDQYISEDNLYEFKINTEIDQDAYDTYYMIEVDYEFNILSIGYHPCMSRLDMDEDETIEIFNNSMKQDVILRNRLSDLREKMINQNKKKEVSR